MRHQQSEPQNLLGNKLFSQWTKVADVSFSNQRIHQPNKSPVQMRPSTTIEHDPKAPLSRLRDAVKVQINGTEETKKFHLKLFRKNIIIRLTKRSPIS